MYTMSYEFSQKIRNAYRKSHNDADFACGNNCAIDLATWDSSPEWPCIMTPKWQGPFRACHDDRIEKV